MIKNIVFDFGGVLVDWNPRYLYRDYFRDDEKMEWFLANICTDDWNWQQDAGRPFAEGIALLTAQYPGYSEAIRLYFDGWEKMLGAMNEETVALMRRLRDRGYALYGLTNWSAETYPFIRDSHECFGWLRGVVMSGQEKVAKPDPAIYRILLDRYHLRPEETLFLDDAPRNIAGANALGIHTILFTSPQQAAKELEQLLQL